MMREKESVNTGVKTGSVGRGTLKALWSTFSLYASMVLLIPSRLMIG
jgi:hypothetical protein